MNQIVMKKSTKLNEQFNLWRRITFTDNDGQFQLDGCGDDFNWLPGVPNLPDPFIRVYHYCNSAKGETLDLPEFDVFVVPFEEINK